ncbi:MAG TPA: deaminase [Acidimicrobiales bacterium]
MTTADASSDSPGVADPHDPAVAGLLAQAVRLAVVNAAAGQLPFAALVVRDGAVLATGVNTALRDRDPVAHAEVEAVRAACRALGTQHLTGATLVSSCEPCAVCRAVAAVAGIARIVYAAPRELVPDLGHAGPLDTGDLLVRMQDALRETAPGHAVHVPVPGADEPFRRFLAAEATGEAGP